jgi:hypothetical protein
MLLTFEEYPANHLYIVPPSYDPVIEYYTCGAGASGRRAQTTVPVGRSIGIVPALEPSPTTIPTGNLPDAAPALGTMTSLLDLVSEAADEFRCTYAGRSSKKERKRQT